MQKQNNFPLRIIAVSKEIENVKLKEINKKNEDKNNNLDEKVRPFNISMPLKTNIYNKEQGPDLHRNWIKQLMRHLVPVLGGVI